MEQLLKTNAQQSLIESILEQHSLLRDHHINILTKRLDILSQDMGQIKNVDSSNPISIQGILPITPNNNP